MLSCTLFPGGKYFLGRRDRKVDTQSSLISLLCGSISSRLGNDGIRPRRWWCHNLRCNISTHSFQFSLAISLSLSLLSLAIHYEEGVNVEEPHNNPKLFRYASHPMPKVLFFSIYATVDGTSFPSKERGQHCKMLLSVVNQGTLNIIEISINLLKVDVNFI